MRKIRKLIDLLSGKTVRQLEQKVEEYVQKLQEKQEHINRTNAYWKKVLYENNKEEKKKK